MKKIGILLAILLVAGVCAMADDAVPATQGAVLFAGIDAVALSQAEMAVVDGGAHIIDKPGDVAPGNSTPIKQPAPKVKVEQDITVRVRIPPFTKYPLVEFEFRRKTTK